MISFENDYSNGAHSAVLEALINTNNEILSPYGTDKYTESAKSKIRKACKKENADVFFLTGGTQTNKVVISTLLKSYEGVIAAQTGHIAGHEAGAIEMSGHKVLTLKENNGKLCSKQLKEFIADFYSDVNHSHMVFPGMVYISHPTEYGTIYSKKELSDLYSVCRQFELPLFIDGARLGYGIMSEESDMTLEDISNLCDVFYIGGTKVGALCGEAVIFPNGNAPKNFMTIIKQNGAMIAKGRLTGVQFDALFTDNLYFEISKNAIDKALKLKEILKKKRYNFFRQSPTNQQFIIVDNDKLEELGKKIIYSYWEKFNDTQTVIRLATSWSTTDEDLIELERIL